ncbi:MAG: thiamine ABC transporter substrate binding subunit [Omnitrophica WOR_2 bacterium]
MGKKIALIMIAILVFTSLILSGCSSSGSSTTQAPAGTASATGVPSTEPSSMRTLTVMTHDSFAASANVIKEFEDANHVKVQFIKAGDAGTALNKAILSKSNPIADVFYGVDNTYLSRGLDEGIYEPYASPVLSQIPDQFRLDPKNRALPVDYGDVCLNYDKAYFKEKGINPPSTLEDLTKPEYKSLLVVENPASSSPGLVFLLTTIAHFGENGYLNYWKELKSNNVKIDDGWESAYYTDFSGSSGHGPRPIVVSYNSSPVFEIVGAKNPPSEPPTAAVVTDDTCFRQIEFVGILKGTKNLDLAEKWVDFMLSKTFQEDMPLQMYVFPVNKNTTLSSEFVKFLVEPKKTATVSPQEIAAKRDTWLQAWTNAVLH